MRNDFNTRHASRDDLPEILDVQAESMRNLATAFYEPEAIEAFIAFGTMEADLLDDGTYFVVERDAKIVATGGWSSRTPRYEAQVASEDTKTNVTSVAAVRSLFVHPNATRRGLASRLMQHIENEILAAGFAESHLTATLSGIPLYRRLGWRSQDPITLALSGDIKLVGLRMTKQLKNRFRPAA